MAKSINSGSGEKGFTLVELSIVMIIIGLLIGGILKGQELIANARLAATVSKIKAIDAALNTFRDSYQGLPGDLVNVTTRLPNCANTTKCGVAITVGTLGDNQIGVGPGAAQATTSENIVAWAQLAAADMIGGVQNGASGAVIASGTTNPSGEIAGIFTIGYANGTAASLDNEIAPATSIRAGHYLALRDVGTTATAAITTASSSIITPGQASRIDLKLDDGAPNVGSVLAAGATTNGTGCASANIAGTYMTANQAVACALYIRIQQ